jgi:hypothetical protein
MERLGAAYIDVGYIDEIHAAGEMDLLDEQHRSLLTYACIYVSACMHACYSIISQVTVALCQDCAKAVQDLVEYTSIATMEVLDATGRAPIHVRVSYSPVTYCSVSTCFCL